MNGSLIARIQALRVVSWALLLLPFFSSPVLADAPVAGAPERPAEHWLEFYYEQPEPQHFVLQVHRLAASGALSAPERHLAMQLFLASLLAQHGTLLDGWMSALADLSEADRETLELALWRADTEAARAWLSEHRPALLALAPPALLAPPLHTAEQLESLWHRFYATGDWALVQQLVAMLPNTPEQPLGSLSAEPLQSPAQAREQARQLEGLVLWSLERHAGRHPQVLAALGRMATQGELSQYQQERLYPLLEQLAPGVYVPVDDVVVP